MDFFTHALFGALIYLLFLKDVTLAYLIPAMFFAILPDLDIFIQPLKRIFKSNYLEHRSGSHSYVIGIIISAILGGIYSIIVRNPFIEVWIITSLFYGLHVSMDLLTTTKIPCFFPLSKKEYCLYAEKAGSFFTMLNSIGFMNLLILLYLLSADMLIIRFVIDMYTYFFIGYYLYRIISKIKISSSLISNQKYLPGVLPFYFTVYNNEISDHDISLSLQRKSHFSKFQEIYNENISLKPEEMVLFERAKELCKANYYLAKWTMFPVFIRADGIFSIRFYFLETLMRNRTMNVQYDFSINNQELIKVRQGYGSILS